MRTNLTQRRRAKPDLSVGVGRLPLNRREEELTTDGLAGNGPDDHPVNRNGRESDALGYSYDVMVVLEAVQERGIRRPAAVGVRDIELKSVSIELGRGYEV